MTDPVLDLIIRIKNGYMSGRDTIESPHSKFREEVAKKLLSLKYLKSYEVSGEKVKKMTIELLYNEAAPAVTDVKIFSRPGRRWYVSTSEIKSVLGGLGYSIISTSQGIMSNVEAKKKKLGGELLFSIW